MGQLRGFAWGGDVVGWMSFGGPILRSVTPLPTFDLKGKAQVDVKWDNPLAYDRVEIWKKKSSETDYRPPPIKTFITGTSEVLQGLNKTTTVGGLEPNTEYQFFVRGWPE